MKPPSENRALGDCRVAPAWPEVVQKNVESLRFGVVQIIVHDGRVVQIERTEKTRLDLPCSC